jgi:hypothetical protein
MFQALTMYLMASSESHLLSLSGWRPGASSSPEAGEELSSSSSLRLASEARRYMYIPDGILGVPSVKPFRLEAGREVLS